MDAVPQSCGKRYAKYTLTFVIANCHCFRPDSVRWQTVAEGSTKWRSNLHIKVSGLLTSDQLPSPTTINNNTNPQIENDPFGRIVVKCIRKVKSGVLQGQLFPKRMEMLINPMGPVSREQLTRNAVCLTVKLAREEEEQIYQRMVGELESSVCEYQFRPSLKHLHYRTADREGD